MKITWGCAWFLGLLLLCSCATKTPRSTVHQETWSLFRPVSSSSFPSSADLPSVAPAAPALSLVAARGHASGLFLVWGWRYCLACVGPCPLCGQPAKSCLHGS